MAGSQMSPPRGAFPRSTLVLPPTFTSTQAHHLLYFLNSIYHSTKRYCLSFPLACRPSAPLGSRTPRDLRGPAQPSACPRRLLGSRSLSNPNADVSYSAAALSSPWRPKNLTAPARHKHVDTALDPSPLYSGGRETEQPKRGSELGGRRSLVGGGEVPEPAGGRGLKGAASKEGSLFRACGVGVFQDEGAWPTVRRQVGGASVGQACPERPTCRAQARWSPCQ